MIPTRTCSPTACCRDADASAILPLEIARLPLVAIPAYALFGEIPDHWVWIGAAVMFASKLYNALREPDARQVNRCRMRGMLGH